MKQIIERIITFRIPATYEGPGRFTIATPGPIRLVMGIELVQDTPFIHLLIDELQPGTSFEQMPERSSMVLNDFHVLRTGDRLPRLVVGMLLRHCGSYTRYIPTSPDPFFFHVFREIARLKPREIA